MLPQEFELYFDHDALKYRNSQKNLSPRHAKWVEFLQDFTFVLNHRSGKENRFANALSRVDTVLQYMFVHVVGFDILRDEYPNCPDFGIIFKEIQDNNHHDHVDFVIRDGSLFRGAKLYIPRTFIRDFLI